MKLLVVIMLAAMLPAAEPEKAEAPKPPAVKVTVDEKLQLKSLESDIWKLRSQRADFLKQSEQQEQALTMQYSALYAKVQEACGKNFQLNEKLECVAAPAPAPPSNATTKPTK